MKIAIDSIIPNPQQPRTDFNPSELRELADSILLHGLINPISVEDAGNGHYILIDGERRWRAARQAGLTEIEASVRPGLNGTGATERLILATVANVQRADMNAYDKAVAYQNLITGGMTQVEVAAAVGLSGSSISNSLLILRLPEQIQRQVAAGQVPSDVLAVRALLDLGDMDVMLAVANGAAAKHMNAGQVVTLARRMRSGKKLAAHNKAKTKAQLSATWAGKWNMIAQAGNPKMPANMRDAAVATCKACALFEDASPKICRDCPAPVLLRMLAVGGEK